MVFHPRSPFNDTVGELSLRTQREHQCDLKMSVGNQFANSILMWLYPAYVALPHFVTLTQLALQVQDVAASAIPAAKRRWQCVEC